MSPPSPSPPAVEDHSAPLATSSPPVKDYSGPGALQFFEVFWRDHQKWLEERGYMLRPRFREGWVPSWIGTKHPPHHCEDYHISYTGQVMDAKRISDGTVVMLKRIHKSKHPQEIEITQMFSAEPLRSDPRNHCVPVLEVLHSPHDEDVLFIVMPFLRVYNDPRFYTIGEAVECVRQLFEGLQFIHQHHVAHRDIKENNVMMDPLPLVSEMYHPRFDDLSYDTKRKVRYSTRTQSPTKYLFIDFGISRQYPEDCISPREPQIVGGDKTVPEFQNSTEPCDPFPTDIYYIGNMIRINFLQKSRGFGFMKPLIMDMVQDDPSKRPTINEVVQRFDKIRSSLSAWKLRSRVVHRKDSYIFGFFRTIRHAYRTYTFIYKGIPALPSP